MLRTSVGRFEAPVRIWAVLRELVRAFKRRDHRRRWRQSLPRRILTRLGWLLGGLLLVLTVLSLVSVAFHEPVDFMKDVKKRCDDTGFACNIASSVFFTVGPLLVGSFWFVSLTLWRVRRPLLKEARHAPNQLVQTAGQITGNVVGRDDICNVLQHNLADRNDRRPYVVVGGVGIGKTAVLVRLTELLARRGAVPVPIRLRDATDDVDFLEMARRTFLRETQSPHLLASAGQRAWDRLLQMDRIVVLADGLEEALADNDIDQERDHRVRTAVSQARRHGYPLVITSREHDALSGLDAALLRLEPLSEEAALDYIEQDRRVEDERRLAQIVETADVVRMPLYLQLTRELHESGQLGDNVLEKRIEDPVRLRMKLAGSWVSALIEGNLDRQPVPLNANERKAAVFQIAALACCGLVNDTIQVEFEMFEAKSKDDAHGSPTPCYATLKSVLKERMQPTARMTIEEIGSEQRSAYPGARRHAHMTATLPRTWDVNMQIAASNAARLGLVERRRKGVRFPHSTMQAYLGSWMIGAALKDGEFVERAFKAPGRELLLALVMFSRRREADERHPDGDAARSWRSWLTATLREAAVAPHLSDAKKIEMLTAAVEVDSVDRDSDHQMAVATLADQWGEVSSWEDAPRDAKLVAVDLVGAAARRLTPERSASPAKGFYRQLYAICCNEPSYQIRLAAAHEIGAGGEYAFDELKDSFREDMPAQRDERLQRITNRENTLGVGENRYRYGVQAWLLPLIVGSGADSDEAKKLLGEWLELASNGMPPWLEAALAQGFKYAANRRPQHPYEHAETRAYLAARAEEMLERADYWFSRLALLHALCLWGLSGTLHQSGDRDDRPNPRAVVERWARRRDGSTEHRFVREAADLAVKALATRQPERFIWIDESGIATTVGSRSKRLKPHALRELWIPPSAGWLILDPRAQQLVADVLILLTLAERGDRPEDWETNLRKISRDDLPHCLTQERNQHLRPLETAGLTKRPPGDTCKGGCPVKLCPYPPKGQQPYRVELSEAFCRKQRELLGRTMQPFKQAPWQNAPKSELRQFWREMERRART